MQKLNHKMRKLEENHNKLEKKKHKAMIESWKKWREKRGSLKTRHKKLKFSWKPKSHTNGTLTPLVKTRHVAMMCVALPLRIKCRTKPQEPCLIRKPSIFRWSSWHITTTNEPRGQLMGLMSPLSLDDLIKYIRPPRHNMDEGKQVINKRIQFLEQLPTSCQTVGASSKLVLISPKALQEEH